MVEALVVSGGRVTAADEGAGAMVEETGQMCLVHRMNSVYTKTTSLK